MKAKTFLPFVYRLIDRYMYQEMNDTETEEMFLRYYMRSNASSRLTSLTTLSYFKEKRYINIYYYYYYKHYF